MLQQSSTLTGAQAPYAGMAKLADAPRLGRGTGNRIQVQVLLPAQGRTLKLIAERLWKPRAPYRPAGSSVSRASVLYTLGRRSKAYPADYGTD